MSESIEAAGRQRTFTVVGEQEGPPGRALLLVFHGSKQDGAAHRRFTGQMYDALAADAQAVVVYLDGYQGNWNDARKQSFFPARMEGVDDVAFVRAVVDRLVAGWGVDRARIVAVGYSNGGQMVLRLLHEVPDLLAGAAVVSATMPAPGSFRTDISQPSAVPVPVVLAHGTKDRIAPFDGGTMSGLMRRVFKVGGTTLSAPETAAYFAQRNGITTPPTQRSNGDVERVEYAELDRASVTLLTVSGGGHTVPGPKRAPFLLGRTARGCRWPTRSLGY
ncbi:alpha/beta hydrolase family esterase [Nocardioides houyundeii]|uniref:alpha/beta hydrolase family esterase n=1 Tax=Nocardioides houyundeii TaxID=2045452 RepID=UPI000C777EDE|nr:PHB depolymerase family esterase [Nocardioides houyundeii]